MLTKSNFTTNILHSESKLPLGNIQNLTSGTNSWNSRVWIVNNPKNSIIIMTRRSWVRISTVATIYHLNNDLKADWLYDKFIKSCHILKVTCICWNIIYNSHNKILDGTRFEPTTSFTSCKHRRLGDSIFWFHSKRLASACQ